jgi:hypothetical protein
MAIPSRQIGWSTKANLLWQISKQLEYLTCVTAGGCGPTTTTTTSTIAPTTTTTTTTAPVYSFIPTYSRTSNADACIEENQQVIYSLSSVLGVDVQLFYDIELTLPVELGWYVVDGNSYHVTGDLGFITDLGTPCSEIIVNVPNRFVDCPGTCPGGGCAQPFNYFDVYMNILCSTNFPQIGCAIWLNIEATVAFPNGSYNNGNGICITITDGIIVSIM